MRRYFSFSILGLITAACLFLLVYPLFIVRPFRQQDPVQLQQALTVFRFAPAATLALAALAALLLIILWKRTRAASRVMCLILFGLSCLAAGLCRVNVFEQMFHPAGMPKFLTIASAKIAPDDMLITVALNNQARAYPIREMAYHHVINDWIGGVPIVATY